MKILLASDTWSPMVNGVVRSVELLYHQLLALGHDVRVVTLAQNGHSHEENGILYVGSISAERVYPGVRISAAGALPISHWLDELEAWGPEVIHTQSEFSTFMLAQRVARRCHCPVVTVPTGIDLTAFGPAKDNGEEKARMRAELGIPEGDTVLLSLGRLAAEKNHAQLVRLLAAQPEQSRPWLVFVGDGPARPDLEALTRELKLTDRVRFAGMVKPDEVPRWYRVGDIFVSASQSETQGLTYFEGMACGLPVLCRADPCLDGVVENGFNGWQWKDEAEFASALNTIISDPALRGQLHQNALATAARYSAEHFAQQVLDAYQQAIALKQYEPEHRSILSWV